MIEDVEQASLGGPQVFFDFGPALFDGIEVGRVRRQVEQPGPCLLDAVAHS